MPAIAETLVPRGLAAHLPESVRCEEGRAFYLVTGSLAVLTLILAAVSVTAMVVVLVGAS